MEVLIEGWTTLCYNYSMETIQQVILQLAIGLPGLLLAIVFHEYAHGAMALRFGDPTAKLANRLTLNPVVHLDPLGSFLVPLVGALLGGVSFGWAKPVPINTRHFSDFRKGLFWVSFAGLLTNFVLVVGLAFVTALVHTQVAESFSFKRSLMMILTQAIYINTIIGVFNLIPIPPLDGSKMVMSFLNYNAQRKYEEFSRFGFLFLLLFLFSGASRYLFGPVIQLAQFLLNVFTLLLSS